MLTKIMVQPSFWVESGITIRNVRGLNLFKFTDDLQAHFEQLLDRHQTDSLTPDEEAELEGIQELDRIFTLLNARIIAES